MESKRPSPAQRIVHNNVVFIDVFLVYFFSTLGTFQRRLPIHKGLIDTLLLVRRHLKRDGQKRTIFLLKIDQTCHKMPSYTVLHHSRMRFLYVIVFRRNRIRLHDLLVLKFQTGIDHGANLSNTIDQFIYCHIIIPINRKRNIQ